MADEEEEPGVYNVVTYTDLPEDEGTEETNWIKRAGSATVVYVDGCTFTGTFDESKRKQGHGVYVWMSELNEEEERTELARYEGNYVDGVRCGVGKFIFPNGDIYEGQFAENMMNGIGTYTYKSSQDIYSGSWLNNKKHGEGRYEYFADKSMMVGTWEQNDMVSGAWELKDSAVYTGKFRMGVPVGPGKFVFKSGLTLPGVFEETNVVAETTEEPVAEEEEGNEGEAKETVPPEPPIVVWRGESIVSF